MKAIICDIDGTLSNSDHRVHHLEGPWKDWSAFFAAQALDPVHEPIAEIIRAMLANYAVLIVTARPEEYRQVTMDWLAQHNIPCTKLYMRPDGVFHKDHDVKAKILQDILDEGYEPFLAFEDKANVAEMWRSYGIMTAQVAPDVPSPKVQGLAGQELLHMMVGPSGAGKSTLIKKMYKPADVVSSDAVRVQLFGFQEMGHNADDLALTWRMVHGQVKLRLENGLFTVLDSTALKRKDRMEIMKYVPRGIQVGYVVVDRDYDDKIRDRDWRPERLIDKHHVAFKSTVKDVLKGDDLPHVTVYDTRAGIMPRSRL